MNTLASSLFTAAILTLSSTNTEAQGSQHVDVNIAGWNASETFGGQGNSSATIPIDVGATVLSFEWINLQYSASGFNWVSDLVMSVSTSNDQTGNFEWLEWSPSTIDFPGNYGPSSGSWGSTFGKPGPYTEGGAFTSELGSVYVTVYNAFPQGDTLELQSGVLRIHLAPVPELPPSGLLAIGLLTLTLIRRRSQLVA